MAAASAKAPTAADKALEAGPEVKQLATRAGRWQVTVTMKLSPDAKPIVVKDVVAERKLIGLYLQEEMKPAEGSSVPDFRRLEFLTFNKLRNRYEYVSMDTRAPVGVMSANGIGPEQGSDITVSFEPFPTPGVGDKLEGKFTRARHVTSKESDDKDVTRQYWWQPGGAEWLAVQYEYSRIK